MKKNNNNNQLWTNFILSYPHHLTPTLPHVQPLPYVSFSFLGNNRHNSTEYTEKKIYTVHIHLTQIHTLHRILFLKDTTTVNIYTSMRFTNNTQMHTSPIKHTYLTKIQTQTPSSHAHIIHTLTYTERGGGEIHTPSNNHHTYALRLSSNTQQSTLG